MVLDHLSLEMNIIHQISLFIVTLFLTRSVNCAKLAIVLKALVCIYKHKLSSGDTIEREENCITEKEFSTSSPEEYVR